MSERPVGKPFFKEPRINRKIAQMKVRRARVNHERGQKRIVRLRDKVCRFPLCGCDRLVVETKTSMRLSGPKGDTMILIHIAVTVFLGWIALGPSDKPTKTTTIWWVSLTVTEGRHWFPKGDIEPLSDHVPF